MRIFPGMAIAALTLSVALAGAASAVAQSDVFPAHHKKVFGYQDPDTGVFHAVKRALPENATTTTLTGTFDVTLNLTIKSSFPSGTKIYCEVVFEVSSEVVTGETTAAAEYGETAIGTASGNTCTARVPYSFVLPVAGSTAVKVDSLSGSYVVGTGLSLSEITAGSTVVEREVDGAIVSAKVFPANGATTTYTIAATL
jgi:hypothetical protein